METPNKDNTPRNVRRLFALYNTVTAAGLAAGCTGGDILSALAAMIGGVLECAPDAIRENLVREMAGMVRKYAGVAPDYPANDDTGEASVTVLDDIMNAAKRGGSVH